MGGIGENAAAGSRLPAPGSEKVSLLDLGSSWFVLYCGPVFVRSSPQPE